MAFTMCLPDIVASLSNTIYTHQINSAYTIIKTQWQIIYKKHSNILNPLDSRLISGTIAAATKLSFSMLLNVTRIIFAMLPLLTRLFSRLQMATTFPEGYSSISQ